jgi:NAD(P)-dependent dehydrogenase (short-subunit alcohol dehydrogenase family)
LEEAKLQRMPKEQPLSRKVALITGSAGGIGKAIAERLVKEGACIIISDIQNERLENSLNAFEKSIGKDSVRGFLMDVTEYSDIENVYKKAALAFGGVDIVINCAGLSISKALGDTTIQDYDILQDVIVKGQFLVSKAGTEILKKQNLGGDIINIVSKNALVSGPNNVAYGTAKAAQLHMSRLLAAELGKDKIRVNVVNPDAVIEGSNIWANGWAKGRAEAYGIKVEELPEYYAKRTILNEQILPSDIANAVFILVAGELNKSTGNVINVDGGVAAAFVR